MTTVDHVLLTRFNLPTRGVEGLIRARDGWLQDRVQLFERYCAPSVAAQTTPICWIVYFDPKSPDWLMERLSPFVADGLFRPVFRSSVDGEQLVADIQRAVPERGDVLITTNLDNDDGLAVDFSARVTSVATDHSRAVIYVRRGLIKTADGVFLRTDSRNAFCSVRESWAQPVTAWSEYHNEFPRVMPSIQLAGPPGWLQVIHQANVSNRVRGRLTDPRRHRDRFGDLLDDVAPPGVAGMAADALLGLPARTVRDGARSAVRVAGLRLLGKDRYQQLKLKLSETTRGLGRGRRLEPEQH